MSITELCRSSDSLLAILAMLFVIAGLFLLTVRFVLSRINAVGRVGKISGLKRLGYALLVGAFVLIISYLAFPLLLNLLLDLGIVEQAQINPCSIRSPENECVGSSGNVTCINMP